MKDLFSLVALNAAAF